MIRIPGYWTIIKKIRRYKAARQIWTNFLSEFKSFEDQVHKSGRTEFELKWSDRYPILNDKTSTTPFDAHYTYHPAWAARIIARTKPQVHIDISSILHFSAMLSAFVPVEFYDYRPAELTLDHLTCKHANLLKLPFSDDSISSLSCMHVVEHIGLGRYGDPLDPDGDLKAIHELKRVLAYGGSLLFVTPVGRPKIRFNAHRIYSYDQIMDYFEGFTLNQFALVDDKNQFTINAKPADTNQLKYGCGCWWFIKS